MADINPTIRYDSDFSKVTADIKRLVREATQANAVFAQLNKSASAAKMQAAQTFASQAGFAGFKAQIVDLTGATEQFGQQLMKNKLTMKEYFREAASAYKKDSKARALAEREVRRAQSTVVGIGDVNGQRKGMLVTPQSLNMKDKNVQLQIANKQYEIFNDLVQKGSTAMVNWGKNTQWAGRQLTVGLTVPMTIFASQALKAFAGLDTEITRFKKVYGSDLKGAVGDATEEMVAQIRGMGSEFAKQYGIASKETMALAADLAAAGLEGQKLANAVNQTTRMMVLGEVDRQQAMTATLSIQTAFNQSSRDLAKSIDFLNAVENQTSASLQDLTEAIPKTGPVIQALGGDIKDLSILMTAMREGGINAAEGANALKSGMASLISPTSKAIEVASQFGIDLQGIVNKNKGELMPLLLGFQDALRGLDDFGKAKLIEEIFGKYQFARISALFDNLNAQGSQTVGMVKLLKASSDELAKKSYSELKAQENAPSTRLAAMQQDLQEQLIKVGADLAETLLPIMQKGLDILSAIVDGFNNLPGPIKSFAKIIGGITVAAGPVLMLAGIFGNLIGNAIKFGMSIINMFKKMTGHPVKTLQILSDQELAAKIAADQLSGAYDRQRTSVMELNAALDLYIANLREAAAIAPPGAVRPGGRGPRPPMPPIRRAEGGVIYAQNGVDSGGKINGYGGGDTVPALLEPGEFVINKQSSAKYAPLLRDINSGKDVPGYTLGTPDGIGRVYSSRYSDVSNKQYLGLGAGSLAGQEMYTSTGLSKIESGSKFEQQLASMATRVHKDLDLIASKSVGGLKEWAKSASIGWNDAIKNPSTATGRILPPIPAELDISDDMRRMLRSFDDFAKIDAGLAPVRGNNAQSKWAASHQIAGKTMYKGADGSLILGAEYMGTTAMEPQSYNNLINAISGAGGTGRTAEELQRITREKIEDRLLANNYTQQQVDDLVRIISSTGAPVNKDEIKLLRQFFDTTSNDEILKERVTKGKRFNLSALEDSRFYTSYLDDMALDDYARYRRDAQVMGVINSSTAGILEAGLGTSDITKQFAIISQHYDELEAAIRQGKSGAEIQAILHDKAIALAGRNMVPEKTIQDMTKYFDDPANSEHQLLFADGVEVAKDELGALKVTGGRKLKGMKVDQIEKFANEKNIAKQMDAIEMFTRNGTKMYRFRVMTPRGPIWVERPLLVKKGGQIGPDGIVRASLGFTQLPGIMSRKEQYFAKEVEDKMVRGLTLDRMKPDGKFPILDAQNKIGIDGLRKKILPLRHKTFGYRASSITPRDLEMYPVGSTIRFDGSKSVTRDPDVVKTFARMNEPGGDYRRQSISKDVAKRYGAENMGVSTAADMMLQARTAEEELKFLDIKRRENARNYLWNKSEIPRIEKELLKPNLDRYDRAELERKLERAKTNSDLEIYKARDLRNQSNFLKDRESIIWELEMAEGLPALEIGNKGYLKGSGVLKEDELVMTNMEGQVVKYYRDADGRLRGRVRVNNAGRFANGGQVQYRRNGGIIFAKNGIDSAGQLNGYGGGDTVPAMLEPGEFVINKESSQKYAPLLQSINRDSLPGFSEGTPSGPGSLNKRLGGGMSMMMNMMFLPMMIPMMNEMEGFTGALMKAVVAIQVFTMALQAGSMLRGGGVGLMAKRTGMGLKGGVGNMLRGQGAMSAFKTQGLAAGLTAAAGPLLLVAAGVAAVAGGIYLWRQRIDELANRIKNMYGEATEMAKVYNIEIKKTGQAMAWNQRQAKSLGMTMIKMGKGQVDKDYEAAVKKDFGGFIDRIKEESSVALRENELRGVFSKLILQGFSKEQAQETTAEIARQSGSMEEYARISKTLASDLGTLDGALNGMVNTYAMQVQSLGTMEEKVQAFSGALENLIRVAADTPAAASAAVGNLVDTLFAKEGAQGIRESLQDAVGKLGFGEGSWLWDKIANTNFNTKAARQWATTILRAISSGLISEEDLQLPEAELRVKVNYVTAMEDAKVELNKIMDERIKAAEEAMKKTNEYYDNLIQKEQDAIDEIQKNHDKKMKQLDDEAAKLNDLKDILSENADYYIKMLQKQYDAERYYQGKREAAVNGLKSLAEGDIYGFLDAQMKSASDAQQFGREQAIKAVEDARDAALNDLDFQLEVNQKERDGLDDATDKAIDKKNDAIEGLQMLRSTAIKGLRDYIDLLNKIKETDVGKITAKQLKRVEKMGENILITLPENVKKGFAKGADQVLEGLGEGLKNAINILVESGDLTEAEAAQLLLKGIHWFDTGNLPAPENPRQAERQDALRTGDLTPSGKEIQTGADSVDNANAPKKGPFDDALRGSSIKSFILVREDAPGWIPDYLKLVDTASGEIVKEWQANSNGATGVGYYKNGKWIPSNGKGKIPGTNEYVTAANSNAVKYAGQILELAALSQISMEKYNSIKAQKKNKGGMIYLNDGSNRTVPGMGNTDTVPAMLTPGEFVMNKAATSANLPLLQAMNDGATPGYNSGGMIRRYGTGTKQPVGNFISPNISSPKYAMPTSNTVASVSNANVRSDNTVNNVTIPINLQFSSVNATMEQMEYYVNSSLTKSINRAINRVMG